MFETISSIFGKIGLTIGLAFNALTGNNTPEIVEKPIILEEVRIEQVATTTPATPDTLAPFSEPIKSILEEIPYRVANVSSEPFVPTPVPTSKPVKEVKKEIEEVKEEVKEPEVPKLSKEEIRKKEIEDAMNVISLEKNALLAKANAEKDIIRNSTGGQSKIGLSNNLIAIDAKYEQQFVDIDNRLKPLIEEYNELMKSF